MKDIIIIGAGGIGRETAWIIEEINEVYKEWNILGFIDDNEEVWKKEFNGYKVLGGIDYLKELNIKPYVVVAIANCTVKKSIVEKLVNEFKFATIIYPNVKVNKLVKIGDGTIIYPGVILTVNTSIGNHVIISGNCGIGHDSEIKDYSSILWGVNISGYGIIEEECLIGLGTSLVQGITIKCGSVVSAGSIVEMVVKK